MDILIIGAGIGGLTAALTLHARGTQDRIRIYETAPELLPLGVGISMRPHAMRELAKLGLQEKLQRLAVTPTNHGFYTHNGQLIYVEPAGIAAGYKVPHVSIHRADLHSVLLEAVHQRLGHDAVVLDHRCVAVEQVGDKVKARFASIDGGPLPAQSGDFLIAADGIHSVVRKQFYPNEGAPVFHGINMWRGVTRMKPFLNGATSVRIGGIFTTGKMVVYPIRNNIDGAGTQLINWVCEVLSEEGVPVDWSRGGKLDDFYPIFQNWTFDWLDCTTLIRNADFVLEYPMVDRDPIDRWTFGRVALLGDAAHPMYPRGGNGGAQAILDSVAIARLLDEHSSPADALNAYERERMAVVNRIVEQNRTRPPDALIDTVERLTGGKRFDNIEDFISLDELKKINDDYKVLASFDVNSVNRTAGKPD